MSVRVARVIAIVALTVLAACANRERVDFVSSAPPEASLVPVLVATTRADDPEQQGIPGWTRRDALAFGRYTVSIPPEREPGRITRPRSNGTPDPQRHFMLTEAAPMDAAGFRAAARAALSQAERREVVIFVHGFNTAFVEGVYRTAQLRHDLRLPGVVMHYSWPSLGAPLAYAHDRDSALFARDGLVQMLDELRAAGVERIVLIAHSMGSQLVVESLRQLALSHDRSMEAIAGVVLISPDIDIELFHAQARAIGTLPQPFYIVTSRRDRILRLSAGLTGESQRLGNIRGIEPVEGLGVTVLDVSAFSQGDGHFTVADSSSLIALIDQVDVLDAALTTSEGQSLPLLPATILTVRNTTEVILQPLTDPTQRRPRQWWLFPFAR